MFTLSLSRWFICATSFFYFNDSNAVASHSLSSSLLARHMPPPSCGPPWQWPRLPRMWDSPAELHCFTLVVVINPPNDLLQSCIIPECLKKLLESAQKKRAIGNLVYIFRLKCVSNCNLSLWAGVFHYNRNCLFHCGKTQNKRFKSELPGQQNAARRGL